MKRFYPSYYDKFKCIASDCKHSCCIGWEIDIDSETYEYYKEIKGDIGKRLRENISVEETPHFILTREERCPFLRADGLCDIIKELSEDALCDICAVHPRFVNELSDRVEVGLGLCCEEAARIILTEKERVSLLCKEDDVYGNELSEHEREILNVRADALSVIQNRELELLERVSRLASEFLLFVPSDGRAVLDMLKPLERLDSSFDEMIADLDRVTENEIRDILKKQD